MTIKLTCGHYIKNYDDAVNISVRSTSLCMFDGYVPAVEYLSVCPECYKERLTWDNHILHTEEEESEWMSSKI